MLRWLVPTILFSAAPTMAATLVCAADGARIEGTRAAQVDVALDGHLYRLANPNTAKPLPGAASDADLACAGRMGLVAIVLPAPKPGPDEGSRGTEALMLRIRSASMALQDPYGAQGKSLPAQDLSELEVDALEEEEETPTAAAEETAAPELAAELIPEDGGAADLGAAAAQGCSSTGDRAPIGLGGLIALVALGLRRRSGGAA